MIDFKLISERYRPQAILSAALLFFFLVSLTLFLFFGGKRDRRYFYFPDNKYLAMDAEMHYVPAGKSREKDMKIFLSELVLGPVDIALAPLFPEGTRIRTLVFRDGVLYVDFTRQILDFQDKIPLTLPEILTATEKNINSNFMGIKKIIFTIEGREPGSAPFGSVQ
jgi:hypothetical protein